MAAEPTEPSQKKTRKRHAKRRARSKAQTPVSTGNVRGLMRRYVGDVGYGVAVKGGIAAVLFVAGYIGDQKFDILGRTKVPPIGPFITEVHPEKRAK